jgi:hypothetical protein
MEGSPSERKNNRKVLVLEKVPGPFLMLDVRLLEQ